MYGDFRMPDSYYDPPEPRECCELWEEEDHDNEACYGDQLEEYLEAKAEDQREQEMFERDEVREWGGV